MKETFKVSLITIFSIIIISLIVNLSDIEPVKKAVSELYLNSIDYNVVMNKDGSMDVVETGTLKSIKQTHCLKHFHYPN